MGSLWEVIEGARKCGRGKNFSNYNHLFVLQTAHEKYIRNKIVPSLYAMSTDDVISDVTLDDDNENQPSNELKSSISVPEKNGLV